MVSQQAPADISKHYGNQALKCFVIFTQYCDKPGDEFSRGVRANLNNVFLLVVIYHGTY
jgi:hypothetical protein